MKPRMTFKERAISGMEQIANQPPVTLEYARAQCLWLKSPKNLEITIPVIEQVLILDKKIREENDSVLAGELLHQKNEIFEKYPALKELYFGIFKYYIDKYNSLD